MFNFFNRKRQPQRLFFNTDIHSHIIPGVDDGASDLSTAADLVERMASWGISNIIATPHVTKKHFENTPDILDPALAEIESETQRRGIDVAISRSAEYRLDDYFLSQVNAGIITPFPNNFLLVENSFQDEPIMLDKVLRDLRMRGYSIILAHPERYGYYGRFRRNRYTELYNAGTFFQVNLLSLAGFYGKEEKQVADYLLEHRMIDFLGTDLHNHRQADAIEQFLSTKRYRQIASSLRIQNDSRFLPR